MTTRALFRSLIAALPGLCCALSQAGSLRVGPTLLTLSAAHPVAAVEVSNGNDSTTAYETELVLWEQRGGEDIYTPVTNVVATPPIFELAPGAVQVLRVGMLGDAPADTEVALRLYVAEVPVQSGSDAARLKMAMRVGVPVFIRAANQLPAKLDWSVVGTDDGSLALQVVNNGGTHAKILEVQLFDRGEKLGVRLPARYVLPGTTNRWPLPAELVPATLHALELQVTTRDAVERATVKW